jgi:hypothetical protein
MNESISQVTSACTDAQLSGISALILSSLMHQGIIDFDMSTPNDQERFIMGVHLISAVLKPALDTKPGDLVNLPFDW